MVSRGKSYSILVAEDDSFQRLALMDILALCNYDVVAVENGRIALEELEKTENHFDLVLLDLVMPEVDGFEMLSIMQEDEKLREIPVIIMSAEAEMAIVVSCLEKGAKDYLIKPIRIQNVKVLEQYINENNRVASRNDSRDKFKTIRNLGQGASGRVDLVERESDQQQFALKTIKMDAMNPKDKKAAENEVALLRVLNGPTIIKYYDSFEEEQEFHIVMEYAEHGNLSERIAEHEDRKDYFEKDQILKWMAHCVIGLMLMHSKNILHRDIKAQNLFLTKDMIVKLGDFGISKALTTTTNFAETSIGTPFFMAPEVIRGDPYGQKSDIWALGCTLYELTMLKKPFYSRNLSKLFEMIKHNDYESLKPDVDADIKMLINLMLQKDPARRPNIWRVANMPCLKGHISDFVATTPGYQESLAFASEVPAEKVPTSNKNNGEVNDRGAGIKSRVTKISEAENYCKMMREDIRAQDYKIGWFKTIEKCVHGEEFFSWFKTKLNESDDNIYDVLNDMLTKELINQVEPAQEDKNFNREFYYRFQQDSPDRAANMICHFSGVTRDTALNISKQMVEQINELYSQFTKETDDGDLTIQSDLIRSSNHFPAYEELSAELQKVDLGSMTKQERICFFLNVYQAMFVHCLINSDEDGDSKAGIFSKLSGLIAGQKSTAMDSFFYDIAGMHFSLNEVKHGVLRGNRKNPECYFKYFGGSDPRAQLLPDSFDRRYHLVLYDMGEMPDKLEVFDPATLNNKLDSLCGDFINDHIRIDDYEEEIVLPKFLQTYKEDFDGKEEEIFKWIYKYIVNPATPVKTLIKDFQDRSLIIRYEQNLMNSFC